MPKSNKLKTPAGTVLIHGGLVQRGDYAYASITRSWKLLQDSQHGCPVSDYVAVARPYQVACPSKTP